MGKISVGAVIAAGGWIFLIGFAGADSGFGPEVINLHKTAIANNIILLGYAVALWGVIETGIDKIAAAASSNSDSTAISTATSQSSRDTNPLRSASVITDERELSERKKRIEKALSDMKK